MPFTERNFFRTLAENSPDIICCVGLDHVMQYVSPSCTRILGWRPDELVGTGPEFLLHPDDLPSLHTSAQRTLTNNAEAAPLTVRVRRKDGRIAWVEMEANPVLDPQSGVPLQVVLVIRDVTEHKQREEELAALASTDALTGLLNRRGFDQLLEKEWNTTVREGAQMSLLLLDVDHFKNFNDQYGHQVGDDCLRAVAAAVMTGLEGTPYQAARYGGEEVAVVLPNTCMKTGMQAAERIRRAVLGLQIPNPACTESGGLVSVSIGLATALARTGGSIRMPENLLTSADTALYKAKRHGRNRIASTLVVASRSH